jgi:hypothetical protein
MGNDTSNEKSGGIIVTEIITENGIVPVVTNNAVY